jgi:hypothetical protein
MSIVSKFAAAAVLVFLAAATPSYAGAFDGLSGLWSGPANLTFAQGNTESMKCRTTFISQGANKIKATVRCANAGMNIEAVALVTELNGSLSGTWEEKVYNSSGTLSGTGDASGLLMKIAGAYSATLTIKIVGSERQIVLTPQGGVVKSLNVRLAKAD